MIHIVIPNGCSAQNLLFSTPPFTLRRSSAARRDNGEALAADLVLSKLPNVGIARLRMPIDSAPGPRNLITKLANYKHIVDVEDSVTIVDDLVKVVVGLIERRATGVFHVTNPGTMRHRDLLALYRETVEPDHKSELIGEDELLSRGLVTHGRANCILSSGRLDALGLTMRPIHHRAPGHHAEVRGGGEKHKVSVAHRPTTSRRTLAACCEISLDVLRPVLVSPAPNPRGQPQRLRSGLRSRQRRCPGRAVRPRPAHPIAAHRPSLRPLRSRGGGDTCRIPSSRALSRAHGERQRR
jgi:hypothetical protein